MSEIQPSLQQVLQALAAASSQTSDGLRKQGESQLESFELSNTFHSLLQVCCS